mgnify:CR=1 FL=1
MSTVGLPLSLGTLSLSPGTQESQHTRGRESERVAVGKLQPSGGPYQKMRLHMVSPSLSFLTCWLIIDP